MDNSTIIFLILLVFFFLKKTRKCSYNKKEHFTVKKSGAKIDQRLKQKHQNMLRKKINERKQLPKIKLDENISLKSTREAYQKSQERKCYGIYSKLANAGKTEGYIKNSIPLFCKNILNKTKNKYVNNTCLVPKEKARAEYIKTMQPIVYVVPSYNDQKLSDNKYADDYRRQFNSLYNQYNPNRIYRKRGANITNTNLKFNKIENKNKIPKKISFINQFNVEFNYDMNFGNQFDSILN